MAAVLNSIGLWKGNPGKKTDPGITTPHSLFHLAAEPVLSIETETKTSRSEPWGRNKE